MKCLSATILRGCNVHHGASVIRQEVDLGVFADLRSAEAGAGFAARFKERFGALKSLNPEGGLSASFLDRLDSAKGVPFVEVLLQAVVAVEDSMGYALRRLGRIAFAEIIAGPSPERSVLVWSCRSPSVSRRVAEVALTGLRELLPEELRRQSGQSGDSFKAAYRSLRRFAGQQKLDYNSTVVVQAAERRGIPWERIGGRYIRLGQGNAQHRINYSATENTSLVAQRLSRDKEVTNRLLTDFGVPVPRQAKPSTIDEALSAAKRFGYPVVIKPLDSNTGKGVSVGLKGPEQVPAAFKHANRYSASVIVESFIEGQDHRLLVVDGKLVAAIKRVPPGVTGDGRSTIGALVAELNRDPRRDGRMLKKVKVDEAMKRLLDGAGYDLESVPDQGETIVLRSTANVSTGGITVDVTDQVHPDNCKIAIQAAVAIGLDVAGVDLIITDISRSYKAVGGAILEVNVRPGIDMHYWPIEGKSRDTAGAVIETMLPPGNDGRIPVALVVGRRGPGSEVAHALDAILRSSGKTVGLVSRWGTFIDGEPAGPEDATRRLATQFVLRHPQVEAVVSTVSPLQITKKGLIHDCCDVAAIVDAGSDGNLDEARQALEVVVRATRGKLVVAAESELALAVVRDLDPNRLVLVATSKDNVALRRHTDAGGRAVIVVEDREIVFMKGRETVAALPVAPAQKNAGRPARRQLEAQIFAAALAHAMDLSGDSLLTAMGSSPPVSTSVSRDHA